MLSSVQWYLGLVTRNLAWLSEITDEILIWVQR